MHKGVLLLTKAGDREEAISKVEEFLSEHGDGKVWDWYVIGGRWSGTLNSKSKEFFQKVDVLFKEHYKDDSKFVSTSMVSEQADKIKAIWTEMGGEGENPYIRSSYESMGYPDDCLPLSECIEVVERWVVDLKEKADEHWTKMLKAKEDEKGQEYGTLSAYYARLYADYMYDSFSFESNVYDIEEYTNSPKGAIEEADKYFAVVVDMHN